MTSTTCHCSICGYKGSWGRFGSIRGLYIRGKFEGADGFSRIGWVCPDCLKKIEATP